MRQIRITKRSRTFSRPTELLPLDPHDSDIVRAKQLARRSPAARTSASLLDRSGAGPDEAAR